MEFITEKKKLLRSLLRIQGIAEKRTLMPILENVLLEAESGKIYFTVTDLEIGMYDCCDAEVIKEGKVALLSRKLLEIVKELPDKNVSFRLEESGEVGKRVEILCGRTAFNISGKDHEDFPKLPVYEDIQLFPIDAVKIREMIRKTVFATSVDEKRLNLSGVLFEKDGEKIRMVGTDGHRLSVIEKEIREGEYKNIEEGVIFPKKGMNELRRILEEDRENKKILIGFRGNNVIFKIDDFSIIMRLVEGKYPDFRMFIPEGNDKNFLINREELLSSLKRVSLVSAEKVKLVKFCISNGKMELIASSSDYGQAYDEIRLDYEGEEMKVGFNAGYFVEVLNVLESKDILLSLKDSETGAIIRPINDESHKCIVMPMVIPEEE